MLTCFATAVAALSVYLLGYAMGRQDAGIERRTGRLEVDARSAALQAQAERLCVALQRERTEVCRLRIHLHGEINQRAMTVVQQSHAYPN